MKATKEHNDGTFSLCVPCVLSRQNVAQENKTFTDSSTNEPNAAQPQSNTSRGEGRGMDGSGMKAGETVPFLCRSFR
jgi:hypothetical protein